MIKQIILLALLLLALGTLFAAKDFVLVKGGTMGIFTPDYEDYNSDEPVSVASFRMAKHEVTVGEFKQFVEKTKYQTTAEIVGKSFGLLDAVWEYNEGMNWMNPGYEQTDSYPVACLSWNDAISYCNWRSQKDGLKPVYNIDKMNPDPANLNEIDTQNWTVTWNKKANGYRLPTVAEWEFAGRNRGGFQRYAWGNSVESYNYAENIPLANIADESYNAYYADLDEYTWIYTEDYEDGFAFASPVGTYPADDLGIYDLGGNISEWCWNWENDDYYTAAYSNDLYGPSEGLYRSRRGPNWNSYDDELFVTNTISVNTDYPSFQYFGMRLVRNGKK